LGKGVFFFGFARPGNWSQLKNVTAKELVRLLRKEGFTVVERGGGKHHLKVLLGKRAIPIPDHAGKTIPQATVREILRTLGLIK